MKLKIALAQINPTLGDINKNIKKHLSFCDSAIKKKADIIVFPELSLTGYALKDLNFELALNPYTSEIIEPLRKKSKKIVIICGAVEEDESNAVYNSALFISDGKVKFSHRKIFPPDYGMFEEMRYFSKGKTIDTYNTFFGKIGILICEDLWHISLPLILALKGAKIIITIAASPTILEITPPIKKPRHLRGLKNYEINSEHHKTYARLLSSYIVFCNRVGYEDGINFWGGSEVVDPFGNVVSLAKFFDEDLIISEIDFNLVRRARQLSRHFLDEDVNSLKNYVKFVYEQINKI